jgi:uncharacterized membrane protein YccC
VEGWGKIVAGVVIGVAGTVYATNEELRKRLPETARDLPDNVRRRFERAVSAAREASSRRREEILRDLERHDASHRAPPLASVDEPAAAETAPGAQVAAASERQGDTEGDGEETP